MVKFTKQNKQIKQMNFFKPVKLIRDNSTNKLNFPKHKLNVSNNVSLFSKVNTSIPKYSKPLQSKQQLKFKLQQKPLKAKQTIKQIKRGYISFGGKPVIVNTKENIKRISDKNLTYAQAKIRHPNIKSFGDCDKDGKLNMFDCHPYDKKRHGSFFDSDDFKKANLNDKIKAIRENRDEWKEYNRKEERRVNKEAREAGYARGWRQFRDENKEDEKEKEETSAEDLVKETPTEEFTKEERADLDISKVISGKVKRKEEKIDPRLDEKYEKYYDNKDSNAGFERSRERYNKFNSPAIPFDDDDDIKRAKNGGSGTY